MEEKKKWNLSAFVSVADEFDALVENGHRGDKGMTVTAAMLMFLTASAVDRQRFVDLVKLAEGRGLDGSVYEAAVKAERLAQALGGEARKREGTKSRGRKAQGLRKVGS